VSTTPFAPPYCVAAHSDETADGAFDDAADFAAHDVIAAAATAQGVAALREKPLWIDAGEDDPFLPGDRAFVAALHGRGDTNARLDTAPGGHDDAYWESRWRDYLAFYAAALAACR